MYRLFTIKQNFRNAFGGCGHLQSNAVKSGTNFRIGYCWHYETPHLHGIACRSQLIQLRPPLGLANEVCGSSNSLPSLRHQSITTSPDQLLAKKQKRKRKPYWKKYFDLMEVTEKNANERRSYVKRLKAKRLQEFILKYDLTRDQSAKKKTKSQKPPKPLKKQPVEYQQMKLEALEGSAIPVDIYDEKPLLLFGSTTHAQKILSSSDEVQNILKSFHNYRDLLETIKHDVNEPLEGYNFSATKLTQAEEDLDPLESANLLSDLPKPSTSGSEGQGTDETAKAKPRFKSKVHNSEEQERLAKERAVRIILKSYLNVCVSTGLLARAQSTLLSYRGRSMRHSLSGTHLVNIELYNIVLNGFANVGSLKRMNYILALIEEDGIAYNEQTFAAIFECIGRLDAAEQNDEVLEKYVRKAWEMGFTLNQIMNHAKFVADQRETVLKTIKLIQPNFCPLYKAPELGYVNPLLDHLNEKVLSFNDEEQKWYPNNEMPGSEIVNSKCGYTKEFLKDMASEQIKIEMAGSITIESIGKFRSDFANSEYCREKFKQLEATWRKDILAAMTREMNTLKAQTHYKHNGVMNYQTYLMVLDAAQYTDILIKEIFKLAETSETFSPTVGLLYKELGHKVQQKYQIEYKMKNGISDKINRIYDKYCEKWNATCSGRTSDNTRQLWQRIVHKECGSGPNMDMDDISWPSNVIVGIGRFLHNIIMRDIKIDLHIMRENSKTKQQNLIPAFYSLFRNQGRVVKEEIKPHPVLARLWRVSRQKTLTFDSNVVPMLCPPQPWSTPHNGGYLLNKSHLIRLPQHAIQQWERVNSANPQTLYPALDSLNQLASIPWRVNKDILDIIIEVFQKGGDHKLDVPQPPDSLPPLPLVPQHDASLTSAERAKLFKEKLAHRRKQGEMYSMWCDTLYRLSLANHYRDKVFWLPHNMDFRGRVYPIPPHLNHLGSDLARSLLIFDQGQPLGPDGFSWLKLHCINLTGLKKRDTVVERMRYVEQAMDDILDSADKPLTGRMWWAKSDEPWQTLACCQEIAKVHRSPNPEVYICHFPIHQDGSCNGLQHYAALGRDVAGAKNVNLAPSIKPKDVYSAVAELVEKARKDDAQNGLHVAQALEGFVKRKVIKQTVMTTVYGVTRFGARLQIARQLKDIDEFPKDWVWPASNYLTAKTFESLREMFTSTREIQDWFTECARLIAGVRRQNVEWVTPLGLPIVQPYNSVEQKHNFRANNRVSEAMSMDMYELPNVIKQKNAFPPNFIHSLDSSHMMLTSLHCERKGLTFVSVHDCFWTHACTVPDMNKICREQFVALHSYPILEELSKFLQQTYRFKASEFDNDGSAQDLSKRKLNSALQRLPKKGDFDLNNVLDSVYFFS